MANLLVKKKNKSLKHYQNRVYDSDGYRRRVDCVLFKDASKDQVNTFPTNNICNCNYLLYVVDRCDSKH